MTLPRALSAIVDGQNAFGRIAEVFLAQSLKEPVPYDATLSEALMIKNATFQWEQPAPQVEGKQRSHGKHTKAESKKVETQAPVIHNQAEPFALHAINISIPREGAVHAIVGPIGSGKSSILYGK